jgi:hypothetical protein
MAAAEDRVAFANRMRLLVRPQESSPALPVPVPSTSVDTAAALASPQLSPKDSVSPDGSLKQEFFKPKKARGEGTEHVLCAFLCYF